MGYKYNYLIEFNTELSVDVCEEIIEQIDKNYGLIYDRVEKVYDREDREYNTFVHIFANEGKIAIVKEVLDRTECKGLYDIYSRLIK